MNKIALYDIDYTIISVNSLLAFIIFLINKFPKKIIYLPLLSIAVILWTIRIMSTEQIKALWLMPLKGLSEKEINKLAKEFNEKYIYKFIKPEAVENINSYKNQGYLTILATASFEFYMKPLADHLNVDYCFGTKVIFNNNKLETKINGANCRGKEKINRILQEIPIDKIQKSGSVGYSDSMSDKFFLELVDKFHIVKRKKWEIAKIINNSIFLKNMVVKD